MHGLPVETKMCILEKLRTQCCSVPKHVCCINYVWNCILENWLNHVSRNDDKPDNFLSRKLIMPQLAHNFVFLCNRKREQDVFNILGVVYGSALFLGFMNCSILQPVVTMERVVLYREKAAGMYCTLAYAIAQVILLYHSLQK